VIKAAQEREALQREGDDLDGRIRLAEKEVRSARRGGREPVLCGNAVAVKGRAGRAWSLPLRSPIRAAAAVALTLRKRRR
jgi:hypothetical protein